MVYIERHNTGSRTNINFSFLNITNLYFFLQYTTLKKVYLFLRHFFKVIKSCQKCCNLLISVVPTFSYYYLLLLTTYGSHEDKISINI